MAQKIEVRNWYEDQEPDAIYEVDGYVEDCVFYTGHFYIDNDRGDGRVDIVRCVDAENLEWETVENGVWITEVEE